MNKLNIKQTIYFCDTETEGLNLNTSRPWEFAWVKMENGKITESESRYLYWDDLNISEKAKEVTGFNQDKYDREALCPKKVYDEISPWFFGNNVLGFHNGLNFDVYQIRNWFREIEKPTNFDWVKKVVDTNALAKALLNKAKPDFQNFDAWQSKWANYIRRGLKTNITFLCKEWGIDIDETRTHQGDYDCYLTAQIYKQIVYKMQES